MMSLGVDLPAKEVIIGLSLLTPGFVVLSGRAPTPLPSRFRHFGLFHGSAFGDPIMAQEADWRPYSDRLPLGLGVVQYAISVGVGWVVHRVWKATEAAAVQARLTGAVVAGVGLFLTMENAEGLVFQMMGLSS